MIPDPSRHSQTMHSTGSSLSGNGINFSSSDDGEVNRNGYYDMPNPQFLIRTVIKNGTDLLRQNVDIQAFKAGLCHKKFTYRRMNKVTEIKITIIVIGFGVMSSLTAFLIIAFL